MTTRCKMKCDGVTKRVGYYNFVDKLKGHPKDYFVYEADLSCVYDNSEENKKFFAATPGGTLRLTTMRDDVFVPGEEYYVDFTPVKQ